MKGEQPNGEGEPARIGNSNARVGVGLCAQPISGSPELAADGTCPKRSARRSTQQDRRPSAETSTRTVLPSRIRPAPLKALNAARFNLARHLPRCRRVHSRRECAASPRAPSGSSGRPNSAALYPRSSKDSRVSHGFTECLIFCYFHLMKRCDII